MPKKKPASKLEGLTVLHPFVRRELRLSLPQLGAMSPGAAWIDREPETHEDGDGRPLTVIGRNMAGLWFVLADDGSIHLVDDVERELGTKVFASVAAFAEELARQNP